MFPSIIYSSPQGSGKTANSAELLQRFSLTDLIDDWKGQEIPSVGTLALTHLSPSQACHMAYRRNQHITLVTEGWKTAEWFRKLGVPNTTLSNSQLRDAIRETV